MNSFRFIFLSVILLFIGLHRSGAQQISIGFGIGISHAQMSGLKSVNNGILKSLPFNAKQVENFPSAKEFNIEVNASITKEYSLGLCYNYFSTGSRIGSKDYSGEYRFDVISSNNSIGLMNKFSVFEAKRFLVQLTAALGWNISTYKLEEMISIYGLEDISDTYNFRSNGMFFNPGVNLLYTFKHAGIGIYGNYYLNTKNEIHLKGEKDMTLINQDTGAAIKSDWNGFKYGVIFLFKI